MLLYCSSVLALMLSLEVFDGTHTIPESNLSCGSVPGHSWGPEAASVHQCAHPAFSKACWGSELGTWLGLI